MVRTSKVCLLLAVALFPMGVAAQESAVERAVATYQAGDATAALELFEHALSEGRHDAANLRIIYMHLGILRASMEDLRGAQEAFAALLTLDPSATIPLATPVAVEAYDRAVRSRRGMAALSMEVSAQNPSEAGRPHVAVVRPTGDSEGLARGARANIVDGPAGGRVVDARGDPPFRLTFPREATASPGDLRYGVELLDAHDSVLLVDPEPRTIEVVPRGAPSVPEGTPPSEPESGSIFGSVWFWTGAAVVVAGGIAIGFAASAGSGAGHVNAPEVVTR